MRWGSAGSIGRAVQIVGAVRWHGLDVAAGLALDSSGRLSTAVWTSADGRTWAAASDRDGTFRGSQVERVVAGPGALAAFGLDVGGCPSSCASPAPVEWLSPDGRSWRRNSGATAFAGARITAAAAGPGGFLAAGVVSTGGVLWSSPDGRSWARVDGGSLAGGTPTGAAWFHGAWVVAGKTGGTAQAAGITPPSTSRAAGWWSTDGHTWHAASVAGAAERGATLGSIAAGRDGMVAVGSDMPHPGRSAFAWTSADGRSWVPAGPDGANLPVGDVRGNGVQIVALGAGPGGSLRVWASLDGVGWQQLQVQGAGSSSPAAPGASGPDAIGGWFLLPDGVLAAGRPRGTPASPALALFAGAAALQG